MRAVALAAALLITAPQALPALAQTPGPAASALIVKGNVDRELVLSIDELKRLPVQRTEDLRVVREQGATAGAQEMARRYPGCLLRGVLDRANLVGKHRMDP